MSHLLFFFSHSPTATATPRSLTFSCFNLLPLQLLHHQYHHPLPISSSSKLKLSPTHHPFLSKPISPSSSRSSCSSTEDLHLVSTTGNCIEFLFLKLTLLQYILTTQFLFCFFLFDLVGFGTRMF